MNTTNVHKAAALLGKVMMVENPEVNGTLLRSFYRARVRLNIRRPFTTGFWVPRRELPKAWVYLRYEKL